MASRIPPSPFRILRTHTAQINTLQFTLDNECLIAGDGSGRVTVTSTSTWRPIADWAAHTDGVLGVQEWEDKIITHGRDYKLHVWQLTPTAPVVADAAGSPTLANPTIVLSLDINSLNYCRFSLFSTSPGNALLALPNLIESELVDVWEIPSATRLHAGVGTVKGAPVRKPFSEEGRGVYKAGIVMSLHLWQNSTHLCILVAYESGAVSLWTRSRSDPHMSVEGYGWETAWSVKHHLEAVMGMAVTRDNALAATVSADHLVCRYNLRQAPCGSIEDLEPLATKHPGSGAIAFRADGRVLGTAGWDGAVRLYSCGRRKMRQLGTLNHFKEGCFALAFANAAPKEGEGHPKIYDRITTHTRETEDGDATVYSLWLAAGCRSGRIGVWELDSFEHKP